MNKVILMGRLTRDPEVRYSQGDNAMAIARYTLAVDRRFNRNNNDENSADFIGCVAFGKSAEFAERYSIREPKLWRPAESRLVAMSIRMASKCIRLMLLWKIRSLQRARTVQPVTMGVTMAAVITVHLQDLSLLQRQTDGFMNIPDGIDEELPFN